MYSLNLMRIALELAQRQPGLRGHRHQVLRALPLHRRGDDRTSAATASGLWDEADEFYYDVLNLPDGQRVPLRVRSMVGLIPLFAVEVLEPSSLRALPDFTARARLVARATGPTSRSSSRAGASRARATRVLLSLLRGHRMKALLRRMLDETEFLSGHGVRAVSKAHAARSPSCSSIGGMRFTVRLRARRIRRRRLFGGNSNWRGPVWMPVNYPDRRVALRSSTAIYGDDFRVECPTGSGPVPDAAGGRARALRAGWRGSSCADRTGGGRCFGDSALLQDDPHFRDHILVPRVLPRRHRPRPRRGAPDGLDRACRAAPAAPRQPDGQPDGRRGDAGDAGPGRCATA